MERYFGVGPDCLHDGHLADSLVMLIEMILSLGRLSDGGVEDARVESNRIGEKGEVLWSDSF